MKTLEEKVQQLSMEVLNLRKELENSEKKVQVMEEKNQRLSLKIKKGSSKISMEEFLYAIEQVEHRYKRALELKKHDHKVRLPKKLSISSVAAELNIDDSTIHHRYKDVVELIKTRTGRIDKDKLKDCQNKLKLAKGKVAEMREERNQRYDLCQKLACNLYRQFIIRISTAHLSEINKGVNLEVIDGKKLD